MNCNAKISRLRTKQPETTTTAPKIKRHQTFTHKMNVPQIRCDSYDVENPHDDRCNGMAPILSHANNMPTGKCTQPQPLMTTLPIYNTSMPSSSSSLTSDMQTTTTTEPSSSSPPSSSPSPLSSPTANQSSSSSSKGRMSMFFFRLHNLQREQENKRKKSVQQRQRQRRGAKVFRSDSETGHLTLAPSRLFEKTPIKPSDSLDEIALQIPRYL